MTKKTELKHGLNIRKIKDYSIVRAKMQEGIKAMAKDPGLSLNQAARLVGLPGSSFKLYFKKKRLPDGPIWPKDEQPGQAIEQEHKENAEASQAEEQSSYTGRNELGQWVPGYSGHLDRPSRIAKNKAEKFAPDVIDRLIKVFKNLPDDEPQMLLAVGKEILDRGLGKPKQSLEVQDERNYEEYQYVEAAIANADIESIRAAAFIAKRLENAARIARRASQPWAVEIIPPPRDAERDPCPSGDGEDTTPDDIDAPTTRKVGSG